MSAFGNIIFGQFCNTLWKLWSCACDRWCDGSGFSLARSDFDRTFMLRLDSVIAVGKRGIVLRLCCFLFGFYNYRLVLFWLLLPWENGFKAQLLFFFLSAWTMPSFSSLASIRPSVCFGKS